MHRLHRPVVGTNYPLKLSAFLQGEQTELEQPLMDAAHQEGPQGDKYIPASFFLDESGACALLHLPFLLVLGA